MLWDCLVVPYIYLCISFSLSLSVSRSVCHFIAFNECSDLYYLFTQSYTHTQIRSFSSYPLHQFSPRLYPFLFITVVSLVNHIRVAKKKATNKQATIWNIFTQNVYLIYCMRPCYRIIFHEKMSYHCNNNINNSSSDTSAITIHSLVRFKCNKFRQFAPHNRHFWLNISHSLSLSPQIFNEQNWRALKDGPQNPHHWQIRYVWRIVQLVVNIVRERVK